jgi:hypothetical protein
MSSKACCLIRRACGVLPEQAEMRDVRVPRSIPRLTTRRVLTMQFLPGDPITRLKVWRTAAPTLPGNSMHPHMPLRRIFFEPLKQAHRQHKAVKPQAAVLNQTATPSAAGLQGISIS